VLNPVDEMRADQAATDAILAALLHSIFGASDDPKAQRAGLERFMETLIAQVPLQNVPEAKREEWRAVMQRRAKMIVANAAHIRLASAH
jgi:hypothetical protein